MIVERKMAASGHCLEIHEEARYRLVAATDGPGEIVLALIPDDEGDALSPLMGSRLLFRLRTGTSFQVAARLCRLFNKFVRITGVITSIPPVPGGDGTPLSLVVDREAA